MKNYINKDNLTVLTMIDTMKVSSKGQVVIPEKMREKLGIKEGVKLIIKDEGDRLIIEKEDKFLKYLEDVEEYCERMDYLALAEQSLKDIWDNPEDEKAWGKYL